MYANSESATNGVGRRQIQLRTTRISELREGGRQSWEAACNEVIGRMRIVRGRNTMLCSKVVRMNEKAKELLHVRSANT